MNPIPIKEQILQEVNKLTPAQQEQLLHLARQMQAETLPPGTPGEVMLADLERYQFAPEDLAEMQRVIEEEREKIDWEGW